MNRLIVAIDRKRGLANHGVMPWKIPEDERYFTKQTKEYGGNVLVGRATFMTFKGPLVDRQNFVLTHQDEPIDGVTLVHDLEKFLDEFTEDLWIVGGATVFKEVMRAGKADELYITRIDADFGCDQFFPEYETGFSLVEQSEPHEQNGFHFTFAKYSRQ